MSVRRSYAPPRIYKSSRANYAGAGKQAAWYARQASGQTGTGRRPFAPGTAPGTGNPKRSNFSWWDWF